MPRGRKPGNYPGQLVGSLEVLERVGVTPDREILWRCRCVCGAEVVVASGRLQPSSRGLKRCKKMCGQTPQGRPDGNAHERRRWEAHQRRQAILEMTKTMTWSQIKKRLGITHQRLGQILRRARAERASGLAPASRPA